MADIYTPCRRGPCRNQSCIFLEISWRICGHWLKRMVLKPWGSVQKVFLGGFSVRILISCEPSLGAGGGITA